MHKHEPTAAEQDAAAIEAPETLVCFDLEFLQTCGAVPTTATPAQAERITRRGAEQWSHAPAARAALLRTASRHRRAAYGTCSIRQRGNRRAPRPRSRINRRTGASSRTSGSDPGGDPPDEDPPAELARPARYTFGFRPHDDEGGTR